MVKKTVALRGKKENPAEAGFVLHYFVFYFWIFLTFQ